MPLNDTQIRNAKPKSAPYRLTDGGGLQLDVRPSGAKFWRYRYRIEGRENMFAAGEYAQPPAGESDKQKAARIAAGKLTLAEARVKLAEWRSAVKQGNHPIALREEQKMDRKRANANTFRAVAEAWIAENKSRWSDYYASQVENALTNHLFAKLGDRPIADIQSKDLTAALTGMQRRRAAVAGRAGTGFKVLPVLIKQWCSAIFRHAAAEGLVDGDPTYALRGRIKRAKVTNHVHLEPKQIAALLTKVGAYGGNPKTVIAIRMLLTTFVRPGELRNAAWSEFDLDQADWNIPAARMKMRLAHWVPLSKQAVTALRTLHALTGRTKLLFPNERDATRSMSATTLNRCLERIGFNGPDTADFSAHGFRATASTLLNNSGKYRADAIERQLAHVPDNAVRGTYNKAEYADERRKMMQEWADMIDGFVQRGVP